MRQLSFARLGDFAIALGSILRILPRAITEFQAHDMIYKPDAAVPAGIGLASAPQGSIWWRPLAFRAW